MAIIEEYYCGCCDRILERDDGEIKQDVQGNKLCPICGEKICTVKEANEAYAEIEADLDKEKIKTKKGDW